MWLYIMLCHRPFLWVLLNDLFIITSPTKTTWACFCFENETGTANLVSVYIGAEFITPLSCIT